MDHEVRTNYSYNQSISGRKAKAKLFNRNSSTPSSKLSGIITTFNKHKKQTQKKANEMDKKETSIKKENGKEAEKRHREETEEENGNGEKEIKVRKVLRKTKIEKTKKSPKAKSVERTHSISKDTTYASLEKSVAKSDDKNQEEPTLEPRTAHSASPKVDYNQNLSGLLDKLGRISECPSPGVFSHGYQCYESCSANELGTKVLKPRINISGDNENSLPDSKTRNSIVLEAVADNYWKHLEERSKEISRQVSQQSLTNFEKPAEQFNLNIKMQEFEEFKKGSFIDLLDFLNTKVSMVSKNSFVISKKDLILVKKIDERLAHDFAVSFYHWGPIAGIALIFCLMNTIGFIYGFGKFLQLQSTPGKHQFLAVVHIVFFEMLCVFIIFVLGLFACKEVKVNEKWKVKSFAGIYFRVFKANTKTMLSRGRSSLSEEDYEFNFDKNRYCFIYDWYGDDVYRKLIQLLKQERDYKNNYDSSYGERLV